MCKYQLIKSDLFFENMFLTIFDLSRSQSFANSHKNLVLLTYVRDVVFSYSE